MVGENRKVGTFWCVVVNGWMGTAERQKATAISREGSVRCVSVSRSEAFYITLPQRERRCTAQKI